MKTSKKMIKKQVDPVILADFQCSDPITKELFRQLFPWYRDEPKKTVKRTNWDE